MTGVYGWRFDRMVPLRRVVQVADAMRSAVLAHLPDGADAPMLAGRSRDGAETGQHRHTHWLPLAEDPATLAGLVAWCPAGWGRAERQALLAVRRLHGTRLEVMPVPVWWPDPSRWWGALTPYVPGRHDVDLADDLSRECGFRGLPTPARVLQVPDDGPRWTTRRPSRRYDRQPPKHQRVLVQFADPVEAPLALGRLAHFGLGMFWPVNPQVVTEKWGIECS